MSTKPKKPTKGAIIGEALRQRMNLLKRVEELERKVAQLERERRLTFITNTITPRPFPERPIEPPSITSPSFIC